MEKLKIAGAEKDAVFFHKPEEPNGYLSNWHMSSFEIDGIRFSSSEQYIMYSKCMLFGDEASAKAALAAADQQELQDIGRAAKGYIDCVWAGVRQLIAMRALLAKFRQNEDLKKKLLDTGDAYLAECAKSDQYWACGVSLYDDARHDAAKWTGQNILGFALMEVRRILREHAR